MKFTVTPLALALLAGPLAAQAPTDADKRIADLEKKVEKLSKAEAKKADDSGFFVKFGGRLHLDTVFYDGNDNRLANGTQLRRGRISFKAGFGKDWVAEGDYDFAEGSGSVKDMWLGYQGFKDTLIQVGQFKAPFGFDTLSSSNAIWFTERSYSDVWTPDRHVGVAIAKWGERWQAKANFFGQAIDDTNATMDTNGSDQGWGYAARFSVAPILVSEAKAVHFGVAMNTRTPNADYSTTALTPLANLAYAVDFSGRPEAGKISKAKFLNAKVANVKNFTQYGAEFAGVWNHFSWQSEYQQTKVNRRDAVGTTPAALAASVVDHKFSVYYGQVSWIFGGQRTYAAQDGLFGKVTPSSKVGALEIVARYSKMNQDDLTTIDPVKGGVAKNMSLGLTWYTNKNIRWMLDYVKVDNNENAKPKAVYGGIANDDFAFTTLRLQVNF